MALNDHGQYSGVVDIARNGIDEVIRLKAQAKADDALILQLLEALEYHRSQTRPIHQTNEAIIRGRVRLQHLSEEKSKEQ